MKNKGKITVITVTAVCALAVIPLVLFANGKLGNISGTFGNVTAVRGGEDPQNPVKSASGIKDFNADSYLSEDTIRIFDELVKESGKVDAANTEKISEELYNSLSDESKGYITFVKDGELKDRTDYSGFRSPDKIKSNDIKAVSEKYLNEEGSDLLLCLEDDVLYGMGPSMGNNLFFNQGVLIQIINLEDGKTGKAMIFGGNEEIFALYAKVTGLLDRDPSTLTVNKNGSVTEIRCSTNAYDENNNKKAADILLSFDSEKKIVEYSSFVLAQQ